MNQLEIIGYAATSTAGAVGILAGLAHAPGTRVIFRRLVRDPIGEWFDARIEQRIQTGIGAEADASKVMIQQCISDAVEPIRLELTAINNAVNNVDPDTPPIKDRVRTIELGQVETHTKLDTLTGLVEALASRP